MLRNLLIATLLLGSSHVVLAAVEIGSENRELNLTEFKIAYHYSKEHRSWKFQYSTNLSDAEYNSLPAKIYYNFYNIKTRKLLLTQAREAQKMALRHGDMQFASGNNAPMPAQILLEQQDLHLIYFFAELKDVYYVIPISKLCEQFPQPPYIYDLTNKDRAGCKVTAEDL